MCANDQAKARLPPIAISSGSPSCGPTATHGGQGVSSNTRDRQSSRLHLAEIWSRLFPTAPMTRARSREDPMERFISDLVKQFEGGTIDRREFCQTVALAAAVYAAGDAANAQTGTGFKVLGINHLSYSCPDY